MIHRNFPIKTRFLKEDGFLLHTFKVLSIGQLFYNEQSAIASGSPIHSDVRSLAKF
ncbi:hypothetical protein [Coleofasciculus sp. FACHB-SPT36]|uniref:hypothetical protein n=1 Tax=Cyanophyceae TaxID=3028117 RepID=UPI00168B4B1F|nr:hypothetical protein [Coleofasciculus sp. FACHB-SPT36]MBD2540301.1 hypothetical protein [Coleofasciculus sp. FACHB-SPT36]